MQERFASNDENPGEHRCPRCGMPQIGFDDSSGQTVVHATCRICDHPLTPDDGVRGARTGSNQSTLQIQWHDWMETRRLERWLWFLFVLGLLTAAVIGLVRS